MIRNLNIRPKIIVSLLLILAVFMVSYETFHYFQSKQRLDAELEVQAERKITRMSQEYAIPLWEVDEEWVRKDIRVEMMDDMVYAVEVSGEGDVYAGQVRDSQWQSVAISGPVSGDFVVRERDVLHNGKKIGQVKISLSRKFVQAALKEQVNGALQVMFIVSFLMLLFMVVALNNIVIRPLQKILGLSQAVGKGDYSVELEVRQNDEVGRLADGIINMRDSIHKREVELEQSQQKYASLVHNMQVAVVVHNPDTSILLYNHLACELLGLTPEQMEGKTAFDPAWHFFDTQGLEIAVEQYPVNRALASKHAERDVVLGLYRPGSNDQIWALVNSNPILGSSGEVLQVVVSFVDITERRRAERLERAHLRIFELAQSMDVDQVLEVALNEVEALTGSRIGFFHFVEEDQETLSLQQWSTSTKAEFCKTEAKGHHYPVSEAGVWADALRTRKPLIHNDYASLPNRKGMPEGHAEVLRELVVPVMRGEKVVAILGVGNKRFDYSAADLAAVSFVADLVWDIVDKIHAEEQAQEMSTRFKAMTDSSPLAIYMSSGGIEQHAEYINPTFTRLFGYTIEDVPSVAKWWPLAYPDEGYRQQVAADWERRVQTALANSANIEPMETSVACKDGSRKQIVWGFFSSGQVDCSFGLDVTASREAEEKIRRFNAELEKQVKERTEDLEEANIQLQELDKLKSMFIASMSHELRTPLNSIIGFTGITLEGISGELNDTQREQLQRVYKAGQHLLSLINDVIDISKVEAGRTDVFPDEFSLQEIIDEAVGNVQPMAAEKKLALNVAISDAEIVLFTDRQRLLQCLLNLLGNAVKFTERGSVAVSFREVGDDVEIAVSDTGIGIAQADIEMVFEAFERLETHMRVKAGGTGLGLYLTRKICTSLLHGNISVESEEGKGSTFTLRILKRLEKSYEQA